MCKISAINKKGGGFPPLDKLPAVQQDSGGVVENTVRGDGGIALVDRSHRPTRFVKEVRLPFDGGELSTRFLEQ